MDRLVRTIMRRNQLKISLLPPELRQVMELRHDYQNLVQRTDAEVARLLNIDVDDARARTMRAFQFMRELDGMLPIPQLEPETPKHVFVSYSWDDDDHKSWVREQIAGPLQRNGLDTHLDQWYVRAGKCAPQFMEEGLRRADFILCILTPDYARKANERAQPSGTGYEQQIITGQLLSGVKRHNIIPLLRKGSTQHDRSDCAIPTHLLGTVYIDFRNDREIAKSMDELLRTLYDSPAHKPPPLGLKPRF